MFDWDDTRYLIVVAELGSTLAASRRLGVSQTTVARRVSALEEALGLRLFERRAAGYQLTDQGRALLPAALELQKVAERFADAARTSVRDVSGVVRITMPEIYATTILAPMLRDFHRAHPAIRIELDTTDALRDLAAGGADIALRLCARPEGGGLIARRVAVDEWSVYCSRAYAAERGQPRNRRELADHVLIAGGEPAMRRHYREWLASNDLEAAVAMEHDTAVGILSAVRAGAGVAAMPCLVADREPELIRCLPSMPQHDRGLWLVVHERSRSMPRIRATLDFVAERFAGMRVQAVV